MLNKSFFKGVSLFTLVMFLPFLLAMPTPCFASGHREVPNGGQEFQNPNNSCNNAEEEKEYVWLLEMFKLIESNNQDVSEEEEEENKEEEENNEGNHRDDDSDHYGGVSAGVLTTDYNSAALSGVKDTSLISQNVCGGNVPDMLEETKATAHLGQISHFIEA